MEKKRTEPVWAAVVVAAGSGTRYGGGVPKQFTMLGGRRVIDMATDPFRGTVEHIVVVMPACGGWEPPPDVHAVAGGSRRQDSVLNGLKKALDLGAEFVLVHDGARPLVDSSTISRVMNAAERTGAAVPCIPVRDTVKKTSKDRIVDTVDRSTLQLAQTPQGFRADLLLEALGKAASVTDESRAVESLGVQVTAVAGSIRNRKLTCRGDRDILSASLPRGRRAMGTGLDFHPFSPDRPLLFCGCRLAEENGLKGHSDGDVVLHAVADAVLSAARIGDIGTLFPPDDLRWKGADSSMLLEKCMELVREKGWKLVSLDVTVIGERPRVNSRRDMFLKRLSELTGAAPGAVWIKGTTTNTIGDLARGAGVGCFAMVELVAL